MRLYAAYRGHGPDRADSRNGQLGHKLHQGRPYGQQAECHCGGGDIRAHRVVSCLGRARMTVAASSCCEPVDSRVNYLPPRARRFPAAKARMSQGGNVSAARTKLPRRISVRGRRRGIGCGGCQSKPLPLRLLHGEGRSVIRQLSILSSGGFVGCHQFQQVAVRIAEVDRKRREAVRCVPARGPFDDGNPVRAQQVGGSLSIPPGQRRQISAPPTVGRLATRSRPLSA
jgi:hypothetical protein